MNLVVLPISIEEAYALAGISLPKSKEEFPLDRELSPITPLLTEGDSKEDLECQERNYKRSKTESPDSSKVSSIVVIKQPVITEGVELKLYPIEGDPLTTEMKKIVDLFHKFTREGLGHDKCVQQIAIALGKDASLIAAQLRIKSDPNYYNIVMRFKKGESKEKLKKEFPLKVVVRCIEYYRATCEDKLVHQTSVGRDYEVLRSYYNEGLSKSDISKKNSKLTKESCNLILATFLKFKNHDQIVDLYAAGVQVNKIAARLGVIRSYVSKILHQQRVIETWIRLNGNKLPQRFLDEL